jgi:LysM repeat protein
VGEQVRASGGLPAGLVQLVGGLAIAFLSICMLVGGFLLSQMDTRGARPTPTQSGWAALPTSTPYLPTLVTSSPSAEASSPALPTAHSTAVRSPSPLPSASPSQVPTESTVAPTPTKSPAPTSTPTPPQGLKPICVYPQGWSPYTVQRGDTLSSLAYRSGTTVFSLMQANCLKTQGIIVGQKLYLPGTFYATPTPYTCGPPFGWTYVYRVQPGDTLYGLSRRFYISMDAIRRANCLADYRLYVGQALYMPPPPPTLEPFPTVTLTPLPTATPIPSPSSTFTPAPTETNTPPSPTQTPVGAVTATSTVTPTLTHTPGPTLTPTETPASTSTTPPATTETPTPTPTETPTDGSG